MGFLGYYNSTIGYAPFERFQLGGDGMQGFQAFVGRDIISQRGYEMYAQKASEIPYDDFWIHFKESNWTAVAEEGELIIKDLERTGRVDTSLYYYFMLTARAYSFLDENAKAKAHYLRIIEVFQEGNVEFSEPYALLLSLLADVCSALGDYTMAFELNLKSLKKQF